MKTNKPMIYRLLAILLAALLLLSGCHKKQTSVEPSGSSGNETNATSPVPADNGNSSENQTPATESPTNETQGQTSANTTVGSGEKDHEVHVPVTQQLERDSTLDAYWNRLDTIAAAAQNYYTENFSRVRLVSRNGQLFNWSSGEPVDVVYLCDFEGLDSRYRGLDVVVLLLYGSDLSGEDKLSIKSSDQGLTVFVAQRHPTEDKYLIVSANSPGGEISSTRYQAILSQYSHNHSNIQTLSPGGDEYDRILSFVKMYESSYGKLFVRSIVADNKYALVTLSSQISTADVKQYILRKNGNLWEVVMSGLESEARLPVAVNKALPDFNLDMLPRYSIYDYRNSVKTTFLDVLNSLINNNFLDSSADIYYIGGTSEYCYVVTLDGQRILCTEKSGGWYPQYVDSANAARKIILNADSLGPTFVVLDQ